MKKIRTHRYAPEIPEPAPSWSRHGAQFGGPPVYPIIEITMVRQVRMLPVGLSTRALKPDSLDPDPQYGFDLVSRELHTVHRLRALHCWTGFYALLRVQHSMQLISGLRLCRGKVVFGCGSKVPCGEPLHVRRSDKTNKHKTLLGVPRSWTHLLCVYCCVCVWSAKTQRPPNWAPWLTTPLHEVWDLWSISVSAPKLWFLHRNLCKWELVVFNL